jgi:preprotein translocase subunit SecY
MQQKKSDELRQRILFTLAVLLVFRLGAHIPVPGIDSVIMQEIAQKYQAGILGFLDTFSGGALGRMSIFALGIMPYITSSIIVQIMSIAFPSIKEIARSGESGKKQMGQITLYLTIAIAIAQSYAIASALEASCRGAIVLSNMRLFKLIAATTLLTGTIALVWISDQINKRGIGNGSSLIIFVGIISGLPSGIAKALSLARKGGVSPGYIIAILSCSLAVLTLVVFVEQIQRKIHVHYPRRQVGNKVQGGDKTYLPLKVNIAGVIPPIFAGSFLSLPLAVATLLGPDSHVGEWISINLSHGKPLFLSLYGLLITGMSFFCAVAIFNAQETAENLRKYGAYIPGKRPGKNTEEYLNHVVTRLTLMGAAYLCCICILPEALLGQLAVTFSLGGTSILIVVSVILETITQIQTFLFSAKYESLIKKIKLKR